jgi:hypothetical protein
MNQKPEDFATGLQWLTPDHRGAPAETLERIRFLCAMHAELFHAVWIVMATHQGLPREILAAAIRKYRSDAESLSQEDIVGLMQASMNGARQAFDAVRRTRRNAPRTVSALPWASE